MAPNGLLKHYEIIECWRKKNSLVSHFEYLADIKKAMKLGFAVGIL